MSDESIIVHVGETFTYEEGRHYMGGCGDGDAIGVAGAGGDSATGGDCESGSAIGVAGSGCYCSGGDGGNAD